MKTAMGGAPNNPWTSMSQPARSSTVFLALERAVKFAIWQPVTKPTDEPAGSPSSSTIHRAAMTSTAAAAGEVV